MKLEKDFDTVQRRLQDYTIFTGESLHYINNNFSRQDNGRPPFSKEDLKKFHSGGKKNRERSIASYLEGSTRSKYIPTPHPPALYFACSVPLGYLPENEDIVAHPHKSVRQLKVFTPHHYHSQLPSSSSKAKDPTNSIMSRRNRTNKKKDRRQRLAKFSSASASAFGSVDEIEKEAPAKASQQVTLDGVLCDFAYEAKFDANDNIFHAGPPHNVKAIYSENSNQVEIGGRKKYVSSVLVKVGVPSLDGLERCLVDHPWVSKDGRIIFFRMTSGSEVDVLQDTAIIRQLEVEDLKLVANNVRVSRQRTRDRAQKSVVVAVLFQDLVLDPNILSDSLTKGTGKLPVNPAIGRRTVDGEFGPFKEERACVWVLAAVKQSAKEMESSKASYDLDDLNKKTRLLNLDANASDESTADSSSQDASQEKRGGRSKYKPSKKGTSKHSPTAKILTKAKDVIKRMSPRHTKPRAGQPRFSFENDSSFSAQWKRERDEAYKLKLKEADAKEEQKRKNYYALIANLRKEGYTIRKIPGDGNCAPLGITDDMPGLSHKDLRHMIADHMIRNPEGFIQEVLGTTEGSTFSRRGYEAAVSKIRNDGEWFDEPQLVASANVLDRDIHVHTPDYEDPKRYGSGASNNPIELIYNGENHYDRVYPPGDDMLYSANEDDDEEEKLYSAQEDSDDDDEDGEQSDYAQKLGLMSELYSSEEYEDEEGTEEEEEGENPARYGGWMSSFLSRTPRNDNGTAEVSPLSSSTGEVHSLAQVPTQSPSPPKRKSKEISKPEKRITRSQSQGGGAASVRSGNSYSTRSQTQAIKKKAKK
eukprot:scaffold20323_cov134-Skeletonema_dohrnii-CCMP3373.AAC.2